MTSATQTREVIAYVDPRSWPYMPCLRPVSSFPFPISLPLSSPSFLISFHLFLSFVHSCSPPPLLSLTLFSLFTLNCSLVSSLLSSPLMNFPCYSLHLALSPSLFSSLLSFYLFNPSLSPHISCFLFSPLTGSRLPYSFLFLSSLLFVFILSHLLSIPLILPDFLFFLCF